MGLMLTPRFWIAVAAAAALVALSAFMYRAGGLSVKANWDAENLREAKAAHRTAERRAEVTNEVAGRHEQHRQKVRVITKELFREVDRYVPVAVDNCPLSGGFRLFHDAAATGEIPDPARLADAAAVTTREAAITIADNYGACRENGIQLESLQEWIRAQGQVK